MTTLPVVHYVDALGRDLLLEWLLQLQDGQAKVQIVKRLNRLESGHFGDHKFCGNGVWELRVDAGPGYRIYCAMAGRVMVLLLCAGSKRTQRKDIERAIDCWRDWQSR